MPTANAGAIEPEAGSRALSPRQASGSDRLHALDALRAFALLAGVVLHATMSFLPGMAASGWPLVDDSPSMTLGVGFFVIHTFRMTTFFLMAGFFGRLLLQRRGVRAFIRDRSVRILVPLVVGWPVVFPLVVAALIWGAVQRTGALPPPPPPAGGAFAFPLTHLWFLYVLALLYVAVLVARFAVGRLDPRGRLVAGADALVRRLVLGPWALPFLAAPLAIALKSLPSWILWGGIPTPDQSLIPNLPAAVAFSTAFGLGWAVHRQAGLLEVFARRWAWHSFVGLTFAAAALLLAGPSPSLASAAPGAATWVNAACYTLAAWALTFAALGIALRFFGGVSAVRRYLSDASYWIYLAHLPVVFLLQAALMRTPLHWSLKFTAIVALTLGLLLATYHAFVRFTFVGAVLNGRRHVRGGGASIVSSVVEGEAPVAALVGVKKRFGATLALDGIDLEVRSGELLALLGPNGAGKTTAISLLLGLQQPDAGTARLFGQAPEQVESRYRVGVMLQEAALAPELRTRELLALTTSYYPAPLSPAEAMELTHTTSLANRPYGKLSGGQKRQVQFALAVCGRPHLLFLDEPTVGLDLPAREMVWATIRRLVDDGASVVLTTHYLEEAQALADRVAVIAKGRLIALGSVDEVRSLVARKKVSCVTDLAAIEVTGWPDVTSAHRERERLHIVASNAETVVRRLLAADAGLQDLEVQRAGLAEAFTELTQEVRA